MSEQKVHILEWYWVNEGIEPESRTGVDILGKCGLLIGARSRTCHASLFPTHVFSEGWGIDNSKHTFLN